MQYNYWSSFTGLEDKEENYSIVSYIIEKVTEKKVIFSWSQQGFSSLERQQHTEKNLNSILEQIKKIAESS